MSKMVHIKYRCMKCLNCQDCRESYEATNTSTPSSTRTTPDMVLQDFSTNSNNLTAKMHAQDPACEDTNMNKLEKDIDHLEYLTSTATKDIEDASNIAHEVAEEGNGNHGATLKQGTPTIRIGNIQNYTRPKGSRKNKTTHLCKPQRLNKHRASKLSKKVTRGTRPSHTKGYSGQLKNPKKSSKQYPPRCKTPPRNSNLTKGLALVLALLIAKYVTREASL